MVIGSGRRGDSKRYGHRRSLPLARRGGLRSSSNSVLVELQSSDHIIAGERDGACTGRATRISKRGGRALPRGLASQARREACGQHELSRSREVILCPI